MSEYKNVKMEKIGKYKNPKTGRPVKITRGTASHDGEKLETFYYVKHFTPIFINAEIFHRDWVRA